MMQLSFFTPESQTGGSAFGGSSLGVEINKILFLCMRNLVVACPVTFWHVLVGYTCLYPRVLCVPDISLVFLHILLFLSACRTTFLQNKEKDRCDKIRSLLAP
jgi:hypothetical protein